MKDSVYMFEKEVNKSMYLRINSSRLVNSWHFQEEFERQKEEEKRQREEALRQWEEKQRQWEKDEQRQLKENKRRWEEYMSDLRTEEEEEDRDQLCCSKCNLIW